MATAIQDLAASTRATSSPMAAASAADIQDRFLTLLVTQLRNQDPLSPMDNAQITTQLSQISTVSGIDKLNDTMSQLAGALAVSQSMSSASMIGRQVLVPGSSLKLADGRAAGALELTGPADRVKVDIVGPAGDIVRSLDLGARPAGLQAFSWDGMAQSGRAAADGAYTFRIEAVREGKAVAANAHTLGTVTGVGTSGKDATLIVNGTAEVRYADVKRIQ